MGLLTTEPNPFLVAIIPKSEDKTWLEKLKWQPQVVHMSYDYLHGRGPQTNGYISGIIVLKVCSVTRF